MIWGRRHRDRRDAGGRERPRPRRRYRQRRARYEELDRAYDRYDDYDDYDYDDYDYDDGYEDDLYEELPEEDEFAGPARDERPPRRRRRRERELPEPGDDEYLEEEPWEDDYADEWEEPRRPRRRRAVAADRRQRPAGRRGAYGGGPGGGRGDAWDRSLVGMPQSLLELSLPIFACAAILPEREDHPQPDYDRFRREVLDAFTRFEEQALRAGYPTEDVMDARYALALFFDEAVQGSAWEGRLRWLGESLNTLFNKDPAGGENFFRRLEELDRSRREVKEVFLACLAAGFNGKLAKLPPAEQGLERARLRREISRELVDRGEGRSSRVFPEAYVAAEPLENVVPPPPRWWMAVSVTVVLVCLLLYGILFWRAGRLAEQAARAVAGGGSPPAAGVVHEGGPGR